MVRLLSDHKVHELIVELAVNYEGVHYLGRAKRSLTITCACVQEIVMQC